MKDDLNMAEDLRAEIDDPISCLLDVINRLIDIEGKTEYQNSEIQDIQNRLSSIINLLDRSKR